MSLQSKVHRNSSFLGNLLGRFRNAVSWQRETQYLDRGEFEAIARELNLSAAELRTLIFVPSGSLGQLSKRLSHEGLCEDELAASEGDVLRDLRRGCSQCQSRARCARDVQCERWAALSKYCPNEQTLQALAAEMDAKMSAPTLALPVAQD
jgi:hypothetical protein